MHADLPHGLDVGHAAKLRERDRLLAIESTQERTPPRRQGVGAIGRIRIDADDVDDVIAGIPGGILAGEHPHEVVDAVVIGEPVVGEPPELLESLGALGTPPKPAPFRLVERPPEHRHVGGGELLELHRDGVDVSDERLIVAARRVGERGGDVERRALRVEAPPPRIVGRVHQLRGRVPVPGHRHDISLLTGQGDHVLGQGAGSGPIGDSTWRVVHQVALDDGR